MYAKTVGSERPAKVPNNVYKKANRFKAFER